MVEERLRVLITAYACEPNRGSEPEVGWQLTRHLADYCDVWVITRANNRPLIEDFYGGKLPDNPRFVWFDLPGWMRFYKKGARGVHFYYYKWQLGAYLVARKLHRQHNFHLAHNLTFVSNFMPSFLPFLRIPFVWGPVGGLGSATPPGFWSEYSLKGRVVELLRRGLNCIGGRFDPFVRLCFRSASAIIASNNEEMRPFRASVKAARIVFPQVGCEEADIKPSPPSSERFTILAAGRILHLKGLSLLLEAFARFIRCYPNTVLRIIGRGGEKPRLLRMVRDLGIGKSVRFIDWLPRPEFLKQLQGCHILAHMSLHEGAGFVIIEALARGKPVVCLDWCGPRIIVTSRCGVKIPPRSPQQVVGETASAFLRLATDKKFYSSLCEGAVDRAREFLWTKRARRIYELYLWVLRSRNRRRLA